MRNKASHVCLLLLAWLTPGALPAADGCAVLEKFKPSAGQYPYRPLPFLAPAKSGGGGVLALDIHMRRFGGPSDPGNALRIGQYRVADVPVFEISPKDGTRAAVFDPDTGATVPLSADCLRDAAWIFGGTRWQLTQSDHLRITLTSDLDYDQSSTGTVLKKPRNGSVPCRATNLHTHGFLVPPMRPADPTGLYGDYVLDVTSQKDSRTAVTDDCGIPIMDHADHRVTLQPLHYDIAIPGQPGQNGVWTGEHPSGLFWYHPHPHGFSRMQTGGGTTGLITVGKLAEYACRQNSGQGKCPPAGALSNIRYLELKDAQLSKGPSDVVHTLVPEYTAGGCQDPAGTRRLGECTFDDGSGHAGIWVFTINGVEYPVITDVKWNEGEVWRIANVSANASYLLQLENANQPDDVKKLQVLAVDGVSVAQLAGGSHEITRILLMPGSRAEVWLSAEPGKTFVLRTLEIATGANDSGDHWPAIDLAEIRWPVRPNALTATAVPAPGGAAAGTRANAIFVRGPHDPAVATRPATPPGAKSAALPPACRLDAGDERHIYLVRRVLGDQEIFGLLAGIRRAAGNLEFFGEDRQVSARSLAEVWKLTGALSVPPPSPAYGSQPFSNVCTLQGRGETWVVENWTGEDHNFHIHQTRFKLDTTKSHLGNPDYYANPTTRIDGPAGLMDTLIRNLVPPPDASRSMWADAYHDSVPVPRGESKCSSQPDLPACRDAAGGSQECQGDLESPLCSPSRISIHVGFQRAEQVGRFVYHCHILEHEDGGMMGEIQVCAKDDLICANRPAHNH